MTEFIYMYIYVCLSVCVCVCVCEQLPYDIYTSSCLVSVDMNESACIVSKAIYVCEKQHNKNS